jgi:hypothetical protein
MTYKVYNILYIAIFMALMFPSCKEEIVSNGNPVPNIQFISISSTKLKQFTDSLVVTLKYKDGDGDLGDISADSLSIYVRDFRLSNPDYYHLFPLSPINNKLSIDGVLNIKIKNIFLLSTSPSETTKFEIKLRDRAKNWSNTIFTPNIEIIP